MRMATHDGMRWVAAVGASGVCYEEYCGRGWTVEEWRGSMLVDCRSEGAQQVMKKCDCPRAADDERIEFRAGVEKMG